MATTRFHKKKPESEVYIYTKQVTKLRRSHIDKFRALIYLDRYTMEGSDSLKYDVTDKKNGKSLIFHLKKKSYIYTSVVNF